MRISKKGQVTIPKTVRDQTGLIPGAEVSFELVAGDVHIRKVCRKAGVLSKGEALVKALRGTGRYAMSTDEIIELMRGQA